jgi:ATP synthase protein I
MVLAVFGCLFFGIWVDGKLGTKPWFTFLFLLIGIVAGFRNIYLLIKNYLKDEQPLVMDGKSESNRKRPPSKKA